jgi:hypothetical protein
MQGGWKGRYSTIFDDGYFKDAAERYLTSGVAGAIGGPMGMIGHKVDLSLLHLQALTDILMDGRKKSSFCIGRDERRRKSWSLKP